MSDNTPPTQPPVQRLELGARDGNNARLAASLDAKAEQINAGAGGWAATEWLGLLTQPCKWTYRQLGRGIRWAVRRFTDHEKRLAEASKLRAQGRATEIKAEADAELTRAKARTELAKARQEEAKARTLELKNEAAAELLEQIKARGIDLAAEMRDGRLHVAVVKPEPVELPAASEAPAKKRRTARRRKPKDDSAAS